MQDRGGVDDSDGAPTSAYEAVQLRDATADACASYWAPPW